MDSQLNELSKGERTKNNPNRYNLRSKKKEGNPDIPDHPVRTKKMAKNVVYGVKEKEANPLVKGPILEVKEVVNPPSSFIFDHEIQNIRIPMPLLELVQREGFKKCLSKML
jgi:hypothetical protein